MQYLRILLSSFGEEDFQSAHQIFQVQIVFGYYFADKIGDTTNLNKAYRPNAHLLYIVMHYNGNIL